MCTGPSWQPTHSLLQKQWDLSMYYYLSTCNTYTFFQGNKEDNPESENDNGEVLEFLRGITTDLFQRFAQKANNVLVEGEQQTMDFPSRVYQYCSCCINFLSCAGALNRLHCYTVHEDLCRRLVDNTRTFSYELCNIKNNSCNVNKLTN